MWMAVGLSTQMVDIIYTWSNDSGDFFTSTAQQLNSSAMNSPPHTTATPHRTSRHIDVSDCEDHLPKPYPSLSPVKALLRNVEGFLK